MANGIYVVPERIERDGHLVAFAGERMTVADAIRRGVYVEPEEAPAEEPEAPAEEPEAPAEEPEVAPKPKKTSRKKA